MVMVRGGGIAQVAVGDGVGVNLGEALAIIQRLDPAVVVVQGIGVAAVGVEREGAVLVGTAGVHAADAEAVTVQIAVDTGTVIVGQQVATGRQVAVFGDAVDVGGGHRPSLLPLMVMVRVAVSLRSPSVTV